MDGKILLQFKGAKILKVKILTYTIFDTPVLRILVRWASIFILKIVGWQVQGRMPDTRRFVLIAAPHTSNWDLPLTLFTAFALRANIYWMGKDAIFRPPLRGFCKWLGGIPIDRSRANSVVSQSIEQFKKNETLILTVPPAGTRQRVMYWKTGFYHIANGAQVPIVLGFLDYRRKVAGIGPMVLPTGDIEADMVVIRGFYKDITGKHIHQSIDSAKFGESPAA